MVDEQLPCIRKMEEDRLDKIRDDNTSAIRRLCIAMLIDIGNIAWKEIERYGDFELAPPPGCWVKLHIPGYRMIRVVPGFGESVVYCVGHGREMTNFSAALIEADYNLRPSFLRWLMKFFRKAS